MSEPSPGEIMRRLDEIATRIDRTASQLQTDRDRADLRYVPRGEWVEGRRADQGLTKDVAKDVAELRASKSADLTFRRQFTIALVGVALSSFASLAIALILLILSGGKT
jgi:hypothetical protein